MEVSEKTLYFPPSQQGIENGCAALVDEVLKKTEDCAIRVIFKKQTENQGEHSVVFTRKANSDGPFIDFYGLTAEQVQAFQQTMEKAGIKCQKYGNHAPVVRTKQGGSIIQGNSTVSQGVRGLSPEVLQCLFPGKTLEEINNILTKG